MLLDPCATPSDCCAPSTSHGSTPPSKPLSKQVHARAAHQDEQRPARAHGRVRDRKKAMRLQVEPVNRQAAERDAFRQTKGQFYAEETTQTEPPKGIFSAVARCRLIEIAASGLPGRESTGS